jgi:ABC-2 type transport system ATP-binding protein
VEGLAKSYGRKVAVRDLTFAVAEGEIFALLGPNGAGKTTTIEILEGYRGADGGMVEVLGLHPQTDGRELKPQVGVVLQQDGVYPALRAVEVLELFAGFFADPVPPGELLDRLGLRDAAAVRCRQLSGGQKRRLALALALVGRPRLLFLDEPTTGMDPQARHAAWEIIREQQRRGATVLLTTHFMDEAEQLADRVAIMDGGELIALDTPGALMAGKSGSATTEVHISAASALSVAELTGLSAAVSARELSPGRYTLETEDARELLAELTPWLRDQHADLVELRVGHSSLEEVFLRLTGKEIRD